MLNFNPQIGTRPVFMFLGAHCDDIEIGCGGMLLSLAERHPSAVFVWVVLSSEAGRADETRRAAQRFLGGVRDVHVFIERFRGSFFPSAVAELKEYIEGLKRFRPDMILTHFRRDLHQDHRVVNELTWNTFRNHAILEYEIPKYDGDLGVPNVYAPLAQSQLERKCEILMDSFPSQHSRAWFSPDTFRAIARLRGIECNAPEGFAEGFHGRKLSLTF